MIFWHSLEHLPEPGEAIRAGRPAAQARGRGRRRRPEHGASRREPFGDRWLHLDLPRHLVHLSTASLATGLESAAGCGSSGRSQVRGGQIVIGWLHGLVGSLPGHPDLYQALRRSAGPIAPAEPTAERLAAIAAGVVLLPVAALAALAEIIMRRGGTIYMEARLV